MILALPLRQIFCRILSLCFVLAALPASASLWTVPLTFQEFGGSLGGFPAGRLDWATKGNPYAPPQTYDVLRQTGSDPETGKIIYSAGQDGTGDLTITSQIQDFSGGRWANLYAGKSNGGLEAGARVNWGTSRSGDSALISLELRFDPALQLTASDFSMRLISANGTSELYEWTMMTLGTASEAPFNPARINDYTAQDYNQIISGTYFNAAGGLTGQQGTGQRLASSRSISQFLAGTPGTPISGGLVQPGWYSIDDFNAVVYDGPEEFLDNPFPGDGLIDDNQTITGAMLGLDPKAPLTAITIWFGYHDVAFDTNGDGFTASDTNIYERVSSLTLGSSVPANVVPEPALPSLLGGLIGGLALRRRRNTEKP